MILYINNASVCWYPTSLNSNQQNSRTPVGIDAEFISMYRVEANRKKIMKRINYNDLTHYFLRDHAELPRAYLDSCEKFFRELKNLKLARLTAANVQSFKQQASSDKPQASSLKLDKFK